MKKLLITLACGVAIGAALWWWHPHRATGKAGEATAGHAQRGGHGHGAGGGVVAVAVAPVQRHDLPVYLDGLGTVQAFNTATVRAQVSGPLVKVVFQEGDHVNKGDPLAQIDPRPFQATLDQARAKLAQDEAALRSAQLDLKRYKDLAPQGYVSGQQLDQQQQTVRENAALVKADQAAVDADQIQLSYTNITAPISGRLGIRQVDVGNLVSASDSTGIVTITQTQPISVLFTLPEQVLDQIKGDPRSLPVTALDRNNDKPLAQGTLAVVNNTIDQTTGTIQLKATFANQDEVLWPGQFVNTRLQASTVKNALTVPTVAVQRGPDGAYVYVIGADDTAQLKNVLTGVSVGADTQITTGLEAGEKVVVDGAYLLKPGAKVKIAPPSAAAPAAAASTP